MKNEVPSFLQKAILEGQVKIGNYIGYVNTFNNYPDKGSIDILPDAQESSKEEKIEEIVDYLSQLSTKVAVPYKDRFEEVLRRILADTEVQEWLLFVNGNANFKNYNKGRVFKLVKIMQVQHVFPDDILGKEINQLLEGTEEDTSYRKLMSQMSIKDIAIEKKIVKLLSI